MTTNDTIDTLLALVEAVRDSRTGGYDVEFEILPNRHVASGTKEEGRTFWLVIEVTDSDPDSELSGQWWFWADGTVMQVL